MQQNPEHEQTHSSFTEIEFDPTVTSLESAAFTSEEFSLLVNQGLKRVERMRAESGFSIQSQGNKIIYSHLIYGTALLYNKETNSHGMAPIGYSTTTAETMGIGELTNDDLISETSGLPQIAFFHYHPDNMPYSNGDIEIYDAENGDEPTQMVKYSGLLMPKSQWTGKKYEITQVTFFCLVVRVEDQNRMNIKGQILIGCLLVSKKSY